MNQNLKKGIFQILTVNIFNVVATLITNFVLPKYLSVNTYAAIKSYQFYINYIGILHLGYADGLYLKYGGKNFYEIDRNAFKRELSTFRIFQFVIQIAATGIAIYAKNTIILLVALSILPYNMFGGFKTIFQALGEFGFYSKAINASTIFLFAVNLTALFGLRSDEALVYLFGYFASYTIIWIVMELSSFRNTQQTPRECFQFSWCDLFQNIHSGILLMLGNFSSVILTGMDRWFIKALMDTLAFAQYSFAVSIENFINFAVTPVSTTLYNYFCKCPLDERVQKINRYILAFSAMLIASAFPAKFILERYLVNYIAASKTIFYLFGAQFFFIIVKSIYVNLYKAQKMQKLYFTKLIIVIVVGAILNAVLYRIMRTKEAFAIGTLLSAALWFVLSRIDFLKIKVSVKELFFLLFMPTCFLVCGFSFDAVIGFAVYITVLLAVELLLFPDVISGIFNAVINIKWKTNR